MFSSSLAPRRYIHVTLLRYCLKSTGDDKHLVTANCIIEIDIQAPLLEPNLYSHPSSPKMAMCPFTAKQGSSPAGGRSSTQQIPSKLVTSPRDLLKTLKRMYGDDGFYVEVSHRPPHMYPMFLYDHSNSQGKPDATQRLLDHSILGTGA